MIYATIVLNSGIKNFEIFQPGIIAECLRETHAKTEVYLYAYISDSISEPMSFTDKNAI